jgi:epoxyqueuosine reductase
LFLSEYLNPLGYKVFPVSLPEKLLAVCSGLAEYGKNNITYVEGMGSFYSPVAFLSDLPCTGDEWFEPGIMEKCHNCKACLIKCPTGAITADRFLIYAEKCLVFHNERSSDYPFPGWINNNFHNCVVGCMLCQQFCPVDKPFLNWFDGNEEFSKEESLLIMQGAAIDLLPSETKAKLERLELVEYYNLLPRNLGVLFEQRNSGSINND